MCAAENILSKINSLKDSNIYCIIEHPGFSPVCLNTWVLNVDKHHNAAYIHNVQFEEPMYSDKLD